MKPLTAISVAALSALPLCSQIPNAHRSFQNVQGYQQILVRGTDGTLWLDQAPFGNVPPSRFTIDANVRSFQALDSQTALVLGSDSNLSLEEGPVGNAPPCRRPIDVKVAAFQAPHRRTVRGLG